MGLEHSITSTKIRSRLWAAFVFPEGASPGAVRVKPRARSDHPEQGDAGEGRQQRSADVQANRGRGPGVLAAQQQRAGFGRERGERRQPAEEAGGEREPQQWRQRFALDECSHRQAHQQQAADRVRRQRPERNGREHRIEPEGPSPQRERRANPRR